MSKIIKFLLVFLLCFSIFHAPAKALSFYAVGGGPAVQTFGSLAFSSTVGIGDSIMAGQNCTGYPGSTLNSWLNQTSLALGVSSPLNQGIPGTVLQNSNGAGGTPFSSNGRDRFFADVCGLNKKDALIFDYGYNDARYIAAPLTFNDTQYQLQLEQVMNGVFECGYDYNHILLGSPYYITDAGLNSGSTGFSGQTRPVFLTFVASALSVGSEYGVYTYDAYTYMLNNGAGSLIGPDNIHPIQAGCDVLTAGALATTKTNLLAPPTVAAGQSANSGELDVTITPPISGSPVSYTSQYAPIGTFSYSGATTGASTSVQWTGLSAGTYLVQTRANFASGPASPWAFSNQVAVSPVVYDTFTDTPATAITSHTGEVGATWIVQPGVSPASPNEIDNANRIFSQTTTGFYQASGTPGSTDYYSQASFTKLTDIAGDKPGIAVRMDGSANTMYFVQYDNTAGSWKTFKTIAGTSTQEGGSLVRSFGVGETHTARIAVAGTAPPILTTWIDGLIVAVRTDTGTFITGIGHPGIRFGGTAQTITTGIHEDNFVAQQ